MLDISNHWGNVNQTHSEIPLTHVRMAITKNNNNKKLKAENNKCCEDVEIGTVTLLVGMKSVQHHKDRMIASQELNIQLLYDPASPLMGIYPKQC